MAQDDLDDKVRLAGPADNAGESAALAAENASLRDRLLRSLADAENTRRRAERNTVDARQYAIADFAAELLAVVDNLQRALTVAEDQPEQTPGEAALVEGVRATQRLLTATLARFGVRKIDALGAPFDPALHEAIIEVEDESPPAAKRRQHSRGWLHDPRPAAPGRPGGRRQASTAASAGRRGGCSSGGRPSHVSSGRRQGFSER